MNYEKLRSVREKYLARDKRKNYANILWEDVKDFTEDEQNAFIGAIVSEDYDLQCGFDEKEKMTSEFRLLRNDLFMPINQRILDIVRGDDLVANNKYWYHLDMFLDGNSRNHVHPDNYKCNQNK